MGLRSEVGILPCDYFQLYFASWFRRIWLLTAKAFYDATALPHGPGRSLAYVKAMAVIGSRQLNFVARAESILVGKLELPRNTDTLLDPYQEK